MGLSKEICDGSLFNGAKHLNTLSHSLIYE